MTTRQDAAFAPASLAPRESAAASRQEVFHRFAAELKALGRPFPRVLDLGSGRGELAGFVLREVPGLRLVALDFSHSPQDIPRQALAHKVGRMTHVTRHAADRGWPEGLGRFDAVISHDVAHDLLQTRRAAALYAQVRALLLPGAIFLIAGRVAGDHDGASLLLTADEHLEAFDEAGWPSVERLRHDRGHLFLKAHP